MRTQIWKVRRIIFAPTHTPSDAPGRKTIEAINAAKAGWVTVEAMDAVEASWGDCQDRDCGRGQAWEYRDQGTFFFLS